MNRRFFAGVLAFEAAACVALRALQASFSGFFSAAIAFPFEQIGLGLRALSLSGGLGNAAAIAIYAAICLSPVIALLFVRRRRNLTPEDGLLGLLSIALFVVLYLMVNPGMIIGAGAGTAGGLTVGKAVLGGMVYSVLCGYLILRALRLFTAGGTNKLTRYMSVMLKLLNVIFVYLAFGACFGSLLDSIASLRAGNIGNEHLLGTSYVFLFLQFAVEALPYVLNVFIVFSALRLLEEMQTDRYSAETVAATTRMSRLCVTALTATVLSNIGFNLLQLLFAKSLMVINSSLQIPVFSIAFVLAALLLTRFVAENKRLKDENDTFI